MDIVFFIFDRITALDAIGPLEVLWRLPGAAIRVCGVEAGPVRSSGSKLRLVADEAIDDVDHADVLVVPGGPGTRTLMGDERVTRWVRAIHETTTWTTSVCTGSLILGGAGLLDGVRATTHWDSMDLLAATGAVAVRDARVVREGKVVTAAGVSSGIDMALQLAAWISDDDTAKSIQLQIEYDPQPPFDSGSIEKASPDVLARLRR